MAHFALCHLKMQCALTKDADLQVLTADDDFPNWEPREFGFFPALLVSILLVAGIIGLCFFVATKLGPKPVQPVIQVTQATLTQLPRPTPPPPPKVVPPPKPVPAIIPKPAPVPSKIVVAVKPPPPIHHVFKPVPKPIINHTPPPPTPAPVSQAPQPPAPAQPTSGIPIYGQQMYNIIQANQNVPAVLASLGASGTAVIEILVADDGHVVSARVIKSSGIPLIDQTALEHARDAHLPPFNSEMPNTTRPFDIPVEISGQTN